MGVYRSSRGQRPHTFRLALADFEASRRAQRYLDDLEISTRERVFQVAAGAHREMRSIDSGSRASFEAISAIVAWPRRRTNSWRLGFLAGIFDAGGSAGGAGTLRIGNTDGVIIHAVWEALVHFGFDAVVERPDRADGMRYVRLRGGLRERLRFFHTTDPAITRKRSIEGVALKSDSKTRVVSVEALGYSLPMYDLTTGTGDFVSNGVISHNCFARPTHTYLDFDAGRDFEKEIVVKVNAPEVLRAQLKRPSWRGEHIAMGTNTDPYQWVEGRYKLMRGIWEALRDFANPCSVLTKSPLVLRDLDLLKEVAAVTTVSANLSVPTLEERAWRATEPHTPHPRARLEAVRALNEAGIPCGVLIAPLMPGINDAPEQVEEILRLAGEAGATGVGGIALHLRGEVRAVFFDWLRAHRPDLVPRYEELYRRGAYAPQAERERLMRLLHRDDGPRRDGWGTAERPGERAGWRRLAATDGSDARPEPPAAGGFEQGSLFGPG